jgi:predicted amidohydrolase YtcJ
MRGMVHDEPAALAAWAAQNPPELDPEGVFHLVTLKAFADGALGSRGAWMYEPFTGTTGVGKPVATPDEIEMLARAAVKYGYQLATHAIGDRALRETMEAFVRGGWHAGLEPTLRFRIEHVQHTRLEDLDRMAELALGAPMQPIHCTRDMRYCDAIIGPERGALSYPWRSVLQRGMRVGFGSDYPIETLNPWLGLHAAVTRQDDLDQPTGGWNSHECVSMPQALDAYLAAGAGLIVADDGELGRLDTVGDFVVVDTDPFTDSPRAVAGTKVLATVVGGQVVHGAL